jgi:hypothetical protein
MPAGADEVRLASVDFKAEVMFGEMVLTERNELLLSKRVIWVIIIVKTIIITIAKQITSICLLKLIVSFPFQSGAE